MNASIFTAARASSEKSIPRLKRAGANLVVSPYVTSGMNIADAILRPKLSEFLQNSRRDGCEFELSQFTVTEKSHIVGRPIKEVGISYPNIVFVALQQPKRSAMIRPGGDQRFQIGDTFTVAGRLGDLERICEEVDGDNSALEPSLSAALT